ncbi:MAG: hypothetical protein WC455_15895 [Dehalococcoidia bacterium]|jgi:hypothetical protein
MSTQVSARVEGLERCPICRKLMIYEGQVDGKSVFSCLDHGEQ